MSVEDFEESLRNHDFNVINHDAAMSKLQKAKDNLQKRYEATIQNITADLKIRDATLESIKFDMEQKNRQLAAMEEKYQNTMGELRKKLEILQKSKEDALSVSHRNEEKLKKELAKSEENLKILKNFCDTQVPGLRKLGYREAAEAMLKKIIHKYPNADMDYFTDLSDIPDIEMETEFDFEVVAGAAEEVAGNAPNVGEEVAGQHEAREVHDAVSTVQAGEQ